MLIDNENKNKKVYEWINEYSDNGTLDIVTGYFTVGALAYLSQITNEKIKKYRFILGDIVNTEQLQNHTINLLNENISIEASLKLKAVAKEAVRFLEQSKVEAKTLEPNFCHAKAYIFNTKKDNDKTFLMGSSNLTEAGIYNVLLCQDHLNQHSYFTYYATSGNFLFSNPKLLIKVS